MFKINIQEPVKKISNICLVLFIFITVLSGQSAYSQVNEDDPFEGNYLIGESTEIVLLRATQCPEHTPFNLRMYTSIYDVDGSVLQSGLQTKSTLIDSLEWGFYGAEPGDEHSQFDVITLDLNGDGRDEVVSAWQGPDFSLILSVPNIDPETMTLSPGTLIRIQDLGFPKLQPNSTYYARRLIRLAAGQFDSDAGEEFVLAYWAEGNNLGGPIQVITFDGNGTVIPTVADSIANEVLEPHRFGSSSALFRSHRFDMTTGDFDGDGTDEIFLTGVEVNGGWSVFGTLYDVVAGQIQPILRTDTPLTAQSNADHSIRRLVCSTGNIDNDPEDDLVISYEIRKVASLRGPHEVFLATVDIAKSLDAIDVRHTKSIITADEQAGHATCLTIGDVDRDSRDEILLSTYETLYVFTADDELNISAPIAQTAVSQTRWHYMNRTIAVTDMDVADNDTFATEIVIADMVNTSARNTSVRLRVFQSQPAPDGLDLVETKSVELIDDVYHEIEYVFPEYFALAVGDFDGDAVTFGPPTRQTVTGFVQPLVILNAPPIHFDVLNGTSYDVNACYGETDCGHRAIYVNSNSVENEVSTEVSADWGMSKSLTAEGGAGFGPISASVSASLEKRYGHGFSNIQGSSETFTVTVTSGAVEDDRIYATVSNYEIFEYPIYARGELVGHVAAVVPKVQGIGRLDNTWFSGKSNLARTYLSRHEVGNIFSYSETVELPAGATLFGRGGFAGGGGTTWEMSGSSGQTWELSFASTEISERERRSYQHVSKTVSAEASLGWGPFSASLSASTTSEYGNEQISTHRTTVNQQSALIVEFGRIDDAILGTKTYTVSPYVYWASNGALVLDYAVQPDVSGGVESWWQANYGSKPDLTFILPWKNDAAKGIGSTNPEVQREETRDILFNPQLPEPGDVVTISTRIQNYSLTDVFSGSKLRFYLGHPEEGGELISNEDGVSEVDVPGINSRRNAVVSLANWRVPQGVTNATKIYAVVDADGAIDEVHEDNNRAWSLLNPWLTDNPTNTESQDESNLPTAYLLHQNYPNPFNPATNITFELPQAGFAKLIIYNLRGQMVQTLFADNLQAGIHQFTWKGDNAFGTKVASGIYLYRLETGEFTSTRKLILAK